MGDTHGFSRRGFIRLCASLAAGLTASVHLGAKPPGPMRRYERVRLLDNGGQSLHPAALAVGENYIFHYPYISTPCFLLNLGEPVRPVGGLETEAGERYDWQGGVGANRSVVAFSAICSHRMTHPAPEVSFINYRHQAASFADRQEEEARRAQVIYCCSEKSVYDPTTGARVLGGPAPQPLAAILLDYDKRHDALYAIGTLGGELFDRFFEDFSLRLALEYGTTDIRQPVTVNTNVLTLDEFSATQVLC